MKTYTTKSGSVYEVDEERLLVRQVARSATCDSGRVAPEWRPYQSIDIVLKSLVIVWGAGRDKHSARADQLGTRGASDEEVTRMTRTSPVVSIEEF